MRKQPVRLTEVTGTGAFAYKDDLTFNLTFSEATGPAILGDGRRLSAQLTSAELSEALGETPAKCLDTGSLMALMRTVDMLNHRESRFTGVKVSDLTAVLAWVLSHSAEGDALDEQVHAALTRLTESVPAKG